MKNIFEITKGITEVKDVFEIVNSGFTKEYENGRFTEFNDVADTILRFVKDTSATFASDVAEKALKYGNPSYKQSWVIAFEFIKNIHLYDAWVENLETLNK